MPNSLERNVNKALRLTARKIHRRPGGGVQVTKYQDHGNARNLNSTSSSTRSGAYISSSSREILGRNGILFPNLLVEKAIKLNQQTLNKEKTTLEEARMMHLMLLTSTAGSTLWSRLKLSSK